MLIGFLWFTLWEQKWRFFGVAVFFVGIFISIITPRPNIILDLRDNLVVVQDIKGDVYVNRDKNKFKVEVIQKKMGANKHFLMKEMPEIKEMRILVIKK
jgi:hypothetical protein